MSAASERHWAARLLAGLGGQPCRDAETGHAGVWIPRRAWENIATVARAAPMAHGYAIAGDQRTSVLDAYEQTDAGAASTDCASDPMQGAA